jgi:hypothetical protein
VLSAGGRIEEAVPQSHGAGVMLLKDIEPGSGAEETAQALHAAVSGGRCCTAARKPPGRFSTPA